MVDFATASKRVIPLSVLQSSELRDIIGKYRPVADDVDPPSQAEVDADEENDSDGSDCEDDSSSVSSSQFSAHDPQQPDVITPARLVNMASPSLLPAVSQHNRKRGQSACSSGACQRDRNRTRGGSSSDSGSDDGMGNMAGVALGAATMGAMGAAGGVGSNYLPSWVPSWLVPWVTPRWLLVLVLVGALLWAGWRHWKLWRARGWQYALSAAFPILRGAVCWISGLDSATVEAEIEDFYRVPPVMRPLSPSPQPQPPQQAILQPQQPQPEQPKTQPEQPQAQPPAQPAQPQPQVQAPEQQQAAAAAVVAVPTPAAVAPPPVAQPAPQPAPATTAAAVAVVSREQRISGLVDRALKTTQTPPK
jgi:hypothetical protein